MDYHNSPNSKGNTEIKKKKDNDTGCSDVLTDNLLQNQMLLHKERRETKGTAEEHGRSPVHMLQSSRLN